MTFYEVDERWWKINFHFAKVMLVCESLDSCENRKSLMVEELFFSWEKLQIYAKTKGYKWAAQSKQMDSFL